MSDLLRDTILRSIRKALGEGAHSAPDVELLSRFVQKRDEAAFELLVWRHAGLVLGVCEQILRDRQAAEDAFQATFIILLRKADTLRKKEALAGWLYQVAYRVSLHARSRQSFRPQSGEGALEQLPAPRGREFDEETRILIHREIQRLPAKYRTAVVCCYLESHSHEEAARLLGWPKGTVAGRLARAREMLRRRLENRGVTPETLGLGMAPLAGELTLKVSVLLNLLHETARTGSVLVGPSTRSLLLAEGVLQAMFLNKMKWSLAMLLLLGFLGIGGSIGMGSGTTKPLSNSALLAKQFPGGISRKKAEALDPIDEATARLKTQKQLRELALAIHTYHDTYAHFPAPATSDKTGKPLLSWRVHLLPYLGESELYKQFRVNERWDSEHNKKLIAKMPAVFKGLGSRKTPSGQTRYQFLVGPGCIFTRMTYQHTIRGSGGMGMGMGAPTGGGGGSPAGPMGGGMGAPGLGSSGNPGGRGPGSMGSGGGEGGSASPGGMLPGGLGGPGIPGMGSGGVPGMPGGSGMSSPVGHPSFLNVTDGLSNTLLIVEAADPVIWTKPEDVQVRPGKPLPKFGPPGALTFYCVLGDGTTRSLSTKIHDTQLIRAITANGGEVLSADFWEQGKETPMSRIRMLAIEKLKNRNVQLKEEAQVLREVIREMRQELDNLRWQFEEERLLESDPITSKLRKENEELEKSLKETRDAAKKMMDELRRLKQDLQRKSKKE